MKKVKVPKILGWSQRIEIKVLPKISKGFSYARIYRIKVNSDLNTNLKDWYLKRTIRKIRKTDFKKHNNSNTINTWELPTKENEHSINKVKVAEITNRYSLLNSNGRASNHKGLCSDWDFITSSHYSLTAKENTKIIYRTISNSYKLSRLNCESFDELR